MKIVCPKCGKEGYLYYDHRQLKSGKQTYFFVYHKKKENGKWKTRKCSIGSNHYFYVTETHNLPYYNVHLDFGDVIRPRRLIELGINSIKNCISFLKNMSEDDRVAEIEYIKMKLPSLLREVRELEEYVVEESRKRRR